MNDPQFWITTVAIALGPILAVQASDWLSKNGDRRSRRVAIFRTLMANRSATLSPSHIEALNLVDVEFHSKREPDRKVVDAWKVYLSHLQDAAYPKESWGAKKAELLHELLFEMAACLRFDFDKSHIKLGTYYPSGYTDAELETLELRRRLLEILRGNQAFRTETIIT